MTDVTNRWFIGRLYGTFKVIDIAEGNVISSTIWKMQCIYCKKIIELNAYRVLRDFIDNRAIKCDCGCNSTTVEDGEYRITAIDRERLKKIRYYIIKNSTDKDKITVDRGWVESLDNFVDWAIKAGYRPYKSLYRRNISIGYNPNNCYWGLRYGRKDRGYSKGEERGERGESCNAEVESIVEKMRLSNGGISVRLYNRLDRDIESIIELVDDFEKHSNALVLLGGVKPDKIDNILLRLSKAVENIEIVKEEMGLNG